MKKNSLILLIIFFSTFMWAACSGTLKDTWTTTSTSYSASNSDFSAEYYTIVVTQAGTINLTINNTSSGNNTRSLTVSLYANGTCSSTAIWNTTIAKSNYATTSIDVSAGTYTLQLTRSNNRTTGYSINGTFTSSTPSFSISSASLTEGNSSTSTMSFPVTISSATTATVDYATTDGTATAGSDYTSASGTLTFTTSGNTTQYINIPIIGDTTIENNETFTVTLSNASGATLSTTTATGTIINDDMPSITVGEREFALRNPSATRNIKGGLQVIGNTVLCVQNNGVCYDYTGGSSNSELDLRYIDIDGVTRNYNNSSQAQLAIPTTATIKWAAIYSQGYLNNNNSTSVATILQDPIYITVPNIGTIASIPEVIDLYLNDNDGYTYDTFAPLTSLIGQTGATVNGWITGANIKANTGTENSGLGNFGAWTLVVVYEDSSSSLKNISVYDGYKRVANATGFKTVNITPSGFLTPTNGDVNSTLSIFVGEGDKNIVGDKLYVNSIAINETNAFYSTISGFTANPSYTNTQGIDIQNHDIGVDGNTSHPQIIGNSATSATITLTSTQDTYFPSMVAFTTNLYQPDVCYTESVSYDSLTVGQNLTYDVNITNISYEPAKGVSIQKTFQDDGGISYVSGSMYIAPISGTYTSVTDANDSDTANYASDSNTSTYYLGTGATSSAGGTIAYGKVTKFKYTAKITDTNISENTYYVSYTNEQLGISFSGIQISKCTDFNNSLIAASAALGKFNVVNQNFSKTTDSNESNSSDNALYTQIAGQDFQVKVLALDSDYTTLKSYTGDVNLSLISQPSYITNDDTGNQALCEAATSLSNITTVDFAAQSSKTVTLNYDTAYKDVAFKLAYKESNTSTAPSYVCSRDSFAIRPATYSIVTSPTYTNNVLTGGKTYTLVATALTNSATTSGYDQNITTSSTDKNATMNLIIPTGCTLDANLTYLDLSFSSGTATNTTFLYKNVGDINVTILDNNWTAVDQNTNNDCIADSNTSTANSDGKVGCLVRNFTLFHFLPKRFKNTLAIANFNSGNFTYLSNDSEMNATASLTTTAILENNTTATNYTAKCYAQDIDYTIALITNPSSTMWGSNYDTAINRIYFIGSSTSHSDANATGEASFSSSEGNFTSGSATVTMFFNFDRNSTLPDQPFTIGKTDFNITSLIDSNNTSGTDFNRTDANTTSLFYYGRAFAPDYTFVTNPGTAQIYYEVYCKDCNSSYRTTMGIDGNESVKAINWYQNTNHTPSTMGTIAPVPVTTSKFSSYTTNNTVNPSTMTLTATGVPLTDKINLNPDTWLQYYPTYYTVTFTSSGNWAGAGTVKNSSDDTNKTGATTDTTIKSGAHIQKRLNW